MAESINESSPFGKDLLSLFGMDKRNININHASAGLEPVHITEKRFSIIRMINSSNELWVRYLLPEKLA